MCLNPQKIEISCLRSDKDLFFEQLNDILEKLGKQGEYMLVEDLFTKQITAITIGKCGEETINNNEIRFKETQGDTRGSKILGAKLNETLLVQDKNR